MEQIVEKSGRAFLCDAVSDELHDPAPDVQRQHVVEQLREVLCDRGCGEEEKDALWCIHKLLHDAFRERLGRERGKGTYGGCGFKGVVVHQGKEGVEGREVQVEYEVVVDAILHVRQDPKRGDLVRHRPRRPKAQ